jgi:hypothetical protein
MKDNWYQKMAANCQILIKVGKISFQTTPLSIFAFLNNKTANLYDKTT